MSKAPAMPLFCGDYLKDTTDLTLEEHGAFLKILMITWATGCKALPDDPARMAARLGVTKDRWLKKIRPVLVPMFDLSDGTWRNERLEREWKYVQDRIAVKRANGLQGGRRKETGPEDDPAGNSQKFTQGMQCNTTEKSPANSLKYNDTPKAIGSGSVKLDESTLPPSLESTSREEDSSLDTHTQKPATALRAVGEEVVFVGKAFHLTGKDYADYRKLYRAIPDFMATLQTFDAELIGQKNVYAALKKKLLNKHEFWLKHDAERKAKQQPKPAQGPTSHNRNLLAERRTARHG